MRGRWTTFPRLGCLGFGRNRLANMLVLTFGLMQLNSAHGFLLPASRSGVNIDASRCGREARCYNRVARREGSRRSTTGICSSKHPPPALPSEPVNGPSNDNGNKKPNSRRKPTTTSTTSTTHNSSSSSSANTSSSSNDNRATASGRSRKPPSRSTTAPTRPRPTAKGEKRAGTPPNGGPPPGADPPQDAADMNVLVPVQDVVPVLLADISQAAADSLGGGEAVRVSMERLCNTLEGVLRTEFSVRVDRANAGLLLGGRLQPKASWSDRPGTKKVEAVVASAAAAAAAAKATAGADAAGPGDKGKRIADRWRRVRAWDRKGENVTGGKRDGAPATTTTTTTTTTTAASAAAAAGQVRSGRLGGGGGKGKSDGDDCGDEDLVPLLQLVEDLAQDALFSPISNRDVVMSQALAAEFPTAARVRPVFSNLANVYGLLHHSSGDETDASDGSGGKGKDTGGGGEREQVPFEGRLLVFRRGNGVEETTGRLLLKKLDYVQSNAVGWLSQSVTDTFKGWQEQLVALVDSFARDIDRRREGIVRSCVEGVVAFGVERDTLARFIAVANETEVASREREAVEEAMEALRRNARRGPVNLQRYGMRQVNVKLEEFSEGGAWPPGGDSWFWDSRVEAETGERGVQLGGISDAGSEGGESVTPGNKVSSAVLPRVTLASVLSPRPSFPKEGQGSTGSSKSGRWSGADSDSESKSVLSRLLSKCTVKEPTYDEVVVVYIKRKRQSPFRTPPALASVWKAGMRLNNRLRRVEQVQTEPENPDEAKSAGLGLQLRVYRGVPLVSLNAITPDKKVEVRPQTALRLDLNSFVGLGLVLANLRFDSLVLVVAATASVVILVVRTIVGYLNARVRVESFVSRDILDKTMGSNVPVLRHLAEEAAQQKSRHIVLVYAALLQCALSRSSRPGDTGEWGTLSAVSTASVARHCGTMMKSCIGMPWEAKVDVPHWLRELESLKFLVRADATVARGDAPDNASGPRSLPLALEGPDTTPAAPQTTTTPPTTSTEGGDQSTERTTAGGSTIVYYHLLAPEAAVEELKLRWSDLVEPPGVADTKSKGSSGDGGYGVSEDATPWARRLGVDGGM